MRELPRPLFASLDVGYGYLSLEFEKRFARRGQRDARRWVEDEVGGSVVSSLPVRNYWVLARNMGCGNWRERVVEVMGHGMGWEGLSLR